MIEERTSTHIYHQQRLFTKEDLAERESLCVHEQPAYCVAACPLKLDAKEMIAAIAKDDFAKAWARYEKITPFPALLAAGCEAPCEKNCKLCSLEHGEGISVSRLEQALVAFTEKSTRRRLPRMKKKQTVAVFGSGLFCLFLVGELHKKAYPVTVFCREENLEEYLAQETAFAPAAAVDSSLSLLKSLDIRFHFSSHSETLEAVQNSFDILCVQYELSASLYEDLQVDSALVFDRAHRLVTGKTTGVLDAACTAKRAALTVDRLAQNLDPSNTRGEEGACETALYTDLTGVLPSASYFAADETAVTKELAVLEAKRCIQCCCDACIRGCAYLQHYKKFPRILTREIYNNVSIIMGDHMMNKPINACSLCGQCSFTCPNGYNMGEICHLARKNMVATGKMPLAPHEFALNDMIFSNTEAFLTGKQPGFSECRYVFFPGCQASAIAPDTIFEAYHDLCSRLSGGVALMLGCCGAIGDWAGRYTLYEETADFLDRELEALGNPVVIAGCPTCMKELGCHSQLTLVGIWDILEQIGLPPSAGKTSFAAALHDSCAARGNHQIQQTIRKLAKEAGCDLIETPYSGDLSPCCGYGGLTSYANPEVAKEMTQKCLERSDLPYLTYCMACRDRFAREGRKSRHLLELIYGTNTGTPPDISEKRFNRLSLKNRLLTEVFGEEVSEMQCEFEVTYTDQALAVMNERMILKSDVLQVLESLRLTGEAVLDEENKCLVTRARIGNVTFWVKYTETDKGYLVQSAYSHRMSIVSRQ